MEITINNVKCLLLTDTLTVCPSLINQTTNKILNQLINY